MIAYRPGDVVLLAYPFTSAGQAKPYQVRQLIKLVEKYRLKLQDET